METETIPCTRCGELLTRTGNIWPHANGLLLCDRVAVSRHRGERPDPTVEQVNALLGVNLYDVLSFRADVRIDFDEQGRVMGASLLNPAPWAVKSGCGSAD